MPMVHVMLAGLVGIGAIALLIQQLWVHNLRQPESHGVSQIGRHLKISSVRRNSSRGGKRPISWAKLAETPIVSMPSTPVRISSMMKTNVSLGTRLENESASSRLPAPAPRRINFVYLGLWPRKGSPMPSAFRRNLHSWRKKNEDTHPVKLWSLEDVLELLTSGAFSEQIVEAFHFASPIQKADLARYCILAAYGGWYFDLDTGVECSSQSSLHKCTNNLQTIYSHKPFDLKSKSGALFWERGPLSRTEQQFSKRRKCRHNVPEYPLRLSNYALFAQDGKGRRFFRTVLDLAACRVLQERDQPSGCDAEYTVLFTTGPDLTSEVAQGLRDGIGRCGTDLGGAHTTYRALNMLVADPKSLVLNANSFTWRGPRNTALRHEPNS